MSTPLPPPPPENRGSLGLGIGLAWACLIAGYTVSSVIAGVMYEAFPPDLRNAVAILAVPVDGRVHVEVCDWVAQ